MGSARLVKDKLLLSPSMIPSVPSRANTTETTRQRIPNRVNSDGSIRRFLRVPEVNSQSNKKGLLSSMLP